MSSRVRDVSGGDAPTTNVVSFAQAMRDATAETPAEVNRARLGADVLKTALAKAVEAGASHLAEAARDAQLLSLEAARALGERVLPAMDSPGSDTLSPASGRAEHAIGTKIEAKSVTKIAQASGVARAVVRRFAQLALGRRVREEDFDRLVVEALDAGKPIPTTKLCSLAKGPPKERRKLDRVGDVQIAFRVSEDEAAAVDRERGEDERTKWVRQLVLDVVGYEPDSCVVRLLDRCLLILRGRCPGNAKTKRAIKDLEGALDRLEGRA
jgi:hypothetical protein